MQTGMQKSNSRHTSLAKKCATIYILHNIHITKCSRFWNFKDQSTPSTWLLWISVVRFYRFRGKHYGNYRISLQSVLHVDQSIWVYLSFQIHKVGRIRFDNFVGCHMITNIKVLLYGGLGNFARQYMYTMRRNLLNNVLHIWSGKNLLKFS